MCLLRYNFPAAGLTDDALRTLILMVLATGARRSSRPHRGSRRLAPRPSRTDRRVFWLPATMSSSIGVLGQRRQQLQQLRPLRPSSRSSRTAASFESALTIKIDAVVPDVRAELRQPGQVACEVVPQRGDEKSDVAGLELEGGCCSWTRAGGRTADRYRDCRRTRARPAVRATASRPQRSSWRRRRRVPTRQVIRAARPRRDRPGPEAPWRRPVFARGRRRRGCGAECSTRSVASRLRGRIGELRAERSVVARGLIEVDVADHHADAVAVEGFVDRHLLR